MRLNLRRLASECAGHPGGGRFALAAALLAAVALLGACASGPRSGRDGPEARPPPGLEQVPDAVPRVEPLRTGGPNKPYEVMGQRHVPLAGDAPLQESGLASWYGRKFHGLPTASGETYDMYGMTAAHKTMPLPSYARVRNPANGREIIVRVNDRGPFASGRVIDLSYTAALKLGTLGGVAPVQVQRITFEEIRSGSWRSGSARPPTTAAAVAPVPPVLTTPVPRIEARLPDDPAPGDGPASLAGFWLQLGAFRQREGALVLQQRLLAEPDTGLGLAGGEQVLAMFEEAGLFRLQAGPWPTRALAQQAADRVLRQTGRSALVVERLSP